MKKPTNIFDHIQDPAFQDRKSELFPNANSKRLSFTFLNFDGDWDTIAKLIARPSLPSVQWFPDSNIAFLDETEVIWDVLRAAGLGIAGGIAGLTSVTLAEMDEWLKLPYRLNERAEKINHAILNSTWLRTIQKPVFPFGLGIRGYMTLLGFRRNLATPLADGLAFVGTIAADKCKTMNAINDRMGPRSQALAKKGRIDAEEKGIVNVSDELHCLIVIANALLRGEDSVILTADSDCIEVFVKAVWLIDTHYRAWLAAKMIKDGYYGDPVETVTETHGFFRGPLSLYRRQTDDLREVLPSEYEPVTVAVTYVTPRKKVQIVEFVFERNMLEMLKMRGATNGRCTDLFDDANVHVDIAPLRLGLKAPFFGVGIDNGINVQSLSYTMFLSLLDLTHCIYCKERFAKIIQSA